MSIVSQLAIYESPYRYTDNTPADMAVAPAVIAFVFFIFFVVFIVMYVFHAFLLSRIFKKASIPQAIAWVPFYNTWKFLELGNQQGFWAILTVIPFVNFVAAVFLYIAMYKIGRQFGKDSSWVVLAVLFPTIWMAIIAFDSSKWHGKTVKA